MIYPDFLKILFFTKKVGKNISNKQFLNQLCLFDVAHAIQDDFLPFLIGTMQHQTNFKAGW